MTRKEHFEANVKGRAANTGRRDAGNNVPNRIDAAPIVKIVDPEDDGYMKCTNPDCNCVGYWKRHHNEN